MVSSLDGYIAKKDNSVSWFETTSNYEQGIADPAVPEFQTADCYIMGSVTYEHAVELAKQYWWPYGDVPTIVLTKRNLPQYKPNIEWFSGDLHQLVNERIKPRFNNAWVVGGSLLAKDFICQNLADEIRQAILPIILGGGTPFYDEIGLERTLSLKEARATRNGLVELCYKINKP